MNERRGQSNIVLMKSLLSTYSLGSTYRQSRSRPNTLFLIDNLFDRVVHRLKGIHILGDREDCQCHRDVRPCREGTGSPDTSRFYFALSRILHSGKCRRFLRLLMLFLQTHQWPCIGSLQHSR